MGCGSNNNSTSLPLVSVGPQGPPGINGTNGIDGHNGVDGLDGVDGVDGTSFITGTVDPISSDGNNGDSFYNKTTQTLFGPKAAGVWPAGISLKGADGAVGPAGATGPQGSAGSPGTPGVNGAPGPTGPTGATGATGPAGPAGPAGKSYLIYNDVATVTNNTTVTYTYGTYAIPSGTLSATGDCLSLRIHFYRASFLSNVRNIKILYAGQLIKLSNSATVTVKTNNNSETDMYFNIHITRTSSTTATCSIEYSSFVVNPSGPVGGTNNSFITVTNLLTGLTTLDNTTTLLVQGWQDNSSGTLTMGSTKVSINKV